MAEPEELEDDLFADLYVLSLSQATSRNRRETLSARAICFSQQANVGLTSYEGDDVPSKPTQPSIAALEPVASHAYDQPEVGEPMPDMQQSNGMNGSQIKNEENEDNRMQGGWEAAGNQHYDGGPVENDDNYGPVGIKEDG
jgi:hypothetical protein